MYSRRIAILILLVMGIALFLPPSVAEPLERTAPITLSSPSYILIEAQTGTVIFEKNADDKRPAASLNKLMSILLFMEAVENDENLLDATVLISNHAASAPGSTALLDANATYRFEDLLRACIVASGNDSTVALAEYIAGSEESFVRMMNERAAAMKLNSTHFINCTGLTADGQYTSARDIAIISAELSKYDLYYRFSSLWLSNITHPSGRITDLTNTNRLVRFYEGCDGMKTGSTPEAKYCISASAQKDGMRLIAVILGASSGQIRFDEARSMLEYGLNTYKRVRIISAGELTGCIIPVLRGDRDSIDIAAGKGLSMLLKAGEEKMLSVQLHLPESITAPLEKGAEIGEIHVFLSDRLIARLPAVLAAEAALPGFINGFLRILDQWR